MRNGTALLAASLALILSLLVAGCGQNSGPAEPEFDQPEYQTPFPARITLDVGRRLGVGNELYMKDDMTGASIPPAEYAERVRDFAQAIRREIPNARIAAIAIDAVASLRDDGQMVVLLSSAAMYRPATVTAVTGGNGGYHLTQHLLTGPAPDAHRATRMIEVPGIEFAKPAPVGERGAMHISTPDSVPVIELEPQRVGATFEVLLPPSSVLRLLLQPQDSRRASGSNEKAMGSDPYF